MRRASGEWCDRVGDAIIEGRFLEDPGMWRDHVEGCETCRRRAEGYLVLREMLCRAREEAPVFEPRERDAEAYVARLRRNYEAYLRRRRNAILGLCAGAVLGLGAFFLARPAAPAGPRDPVAYARELNDRIFPRGEDPRYDLLGNDAALREEYVAALDHPSGIVRRAALQALTMSSVALDPARLEAILRNAREDLEAPLVTAGLSGAGEALARALDARRTATLQSVLFGASQQAAATGRAALPQDLVLPYLGHQDASVRQAAVMALDADPAFRPGEEIARLMREDPYDYVRWAAASCLIGRGGEAGARAAIEHYRASRDAYEALAVAPLCKTAAGLAFARERVADAQAPPGIALLHARALLRAGEKGAPAALLERALSDRDPEVHRVLAEVAREADWARCRGALQERWRAAAGDARSRIGADLLAWDAERGREGWRERAGEIWAASREDPQVRRALEALAKAADPLIRGRALALMSPGPAAGPGEPDHR